MSGPVAAAPIGYAELLRGNANFRRLWAGQVVSLLGDWFSLIASAALIGNLTGSGLAVGSLFVVRMLAPFVVAPVAGVFADRYSRKWLMIWSDLARAVVVCGFLLVREADDVWLLYTLSAVLLGVSGFFNPAHTAILPDLVAARAIGAANALSSATWSVMLAFGAALGGLVSGAWGIYPAFAVDAVTFLVSAAILLRLRPEDSAAATGVPPDTPSGATSAYGQFLEGLRYLMNHRDIAVTALQKPWLLVFFASAMEVTRVTIGTEVYSIGEGGSGSLGIMYAMVGLGTGLGPIFARRITGDRPAALRVAIFIAYLLSCAGMLAVSTFSHLGVVLAGVFLRGTGSGIIWVFSTQLLLQSVREEVRGRVFSTEAAVTTLAGAAGAAMGGEMLDLLPLAAVVQWLAGLALVPAVLWGLWILTHKGPHDAPTPSAVDPTRSTP